MVAFFRREMVHGLPIGFIAVAFVLAARGAYFSSDDPTFLYSATADPQAIEGILVPVGRWLNAALLKASFARVPDIEGLFHLRLMSALFLCIFAVLLGVFLRRIGAGRSVAAAVPVLALMTPSAMPIVAWGQHWTVSLGYCLCAAGFLALVHTGRRRIRDRTVGFVLCTTLVYLAASINQQILGVCAFLVFVIAYYKTDRHDVAWVFVPASAAVVLAYVLAFATVRFGVQVPDHRTSISLDLVENLSWFVHEPLNNALFLFGFRPEGYAYLNVPIILFCCVVAGGILCLKGHVRRVAVGILFLACIPLSYAPVLLASENWASYRSAFPLQIYLGGTFFLFVFTLADRVLPRRASTMLIIGLPLAAAINWTLLFDTHMRTPYTREAENARAQVLAYFQSPIQNEPGTEIPVLYPRWDEGFVEVMHYDDIGGPIVRVWTVVPLVSLYYEQQQGNPLQAKVVPIDFENRDAVLQGARQFIDLTNFADRSLMKP